MMLQKIETKIYEGRGMKVMLDFDLAEHSNCQSLCFYEEIRFGS